MDLMDAFSENTLQSRQAALDACIDRLLAGPGFPQKEFVIGQTTYSALYAMAADLRMRLGPGAEAPPVCLFAQDKAVMAAALLASLAGGPTLVTPHAFTPAVLKELQRLTGFQTIVSDLSTPALDGVRCIQPTPNVESLAPCTALPRKASDSEWVRLFTGGSTGAPRMWTKTVRNLLSETISIVSTYGVTSDERLAATVSPNHIYGLLYAVLTPLVAEAAAVHQIPSYPAEIEAVVRDNSATILIGAPAHFRALNGYPFTPRSLRLAFSSAGMLAVEDAMAFSAQTGVGIAEIYGSTETGGIAFRIRANGESDYQPCAGIDVRIEGEQLKVRSDYLSPELALDREGYFTVGDRVREAAGNRFELLGRVDGIVKVGGRRVDLEAVRQSLRRQPGVIDALAISLPVGRGRENQIVAIVEASAATVNPASLRLDDLETCARPRCIRVVDKIPMTAAGKYDRKTIEALFRPGGRGFESE